MEHRLREFVGSLSLQKDETIKIMVTSDKEDQNSIRRASVGKVESRSKNIQESSGVKKKAVQDRSGGNIAKVLVCQMVSKRSGTDRTQNFLLLCPRRLYEWINIRGILHIGAAMFLVYCCRSRYTMSYLKAAYLAKDKI